MNKKTNTWIFYAYIGLFFLLAVLPLNTHGELNAVRVGKLRGDYFFHFLYFLPFVYLATRFFRFSGRLFVIGLLFAIFSEVIQAPLPYRSFNILDMTSNLTGLLLGGIVLFFPPRMN